MQYKILFFIGYLTSSIVTMSLVYSHVGTTTGYAAVTDGAYLLG